MLLAYRKLSRADQEGWYSMAQQNPISVDFVGAGRPSPWTPAEKQTANSPLRWIPAQARLLATAEAVRGESWSLAEVCDHLALALDSTVRGHGGEGPPRRWKALSRIERAKRWCIKQFMLATGWFPRGVPAPASVTPSSSVLLDDALARLEDAAAAFDRKCASSDSTWGYHSLLGRMSGPAWRRFHAIHAAHHFSFFKANDEI
jgi:hypothetical protein